MLKKIRKYLKAKKEYKNAKKEAVLMILRHYNDLLVSEINTKEAETQAYESMITFGDNFKTEDLEKLIAGVDKIANNPDLQTAYYEQVSKQAHDEKMYKQMHAERIVN